ncbi:hypothetical protein ACLOJK_000953 [Asimina triloba]
MIGTYEIRNIRVALSRPPYHIRQAPKRVGVLELPETDTILWAHSSTCKSKHHCRGRMQRKEETTNEVTDEDSNGNYFREKGILKSQLVPNQLNSGHTEHAPDNTDMNGRFSIKPANKKRKLRAKRARARRPPILSGTFLCNARGLDVTPKSQGKRSHLGEPEGDIMQTPLGQFVGGDTSAASDKPALLTQPHVMLASDVRALVYVV